MEIEQQQIAEFVADDLTDLGYLCKVKEDGKYRIWSRGIPYKIQRLKIVSTKKLNKNDLEEFERLKKQLAYEYGKSRQASYKKEQKELKKKAKEEKKNE